LSIFEIRLNYEPSFSKISPAYGFRPSAKKTEKNGLRLPAFGQKNKKKRPTASGLRPKTEKKAFKQTDVS